MPKPVVADNILFDLDGTLVDSADDIIACLDRAYSLFSPELVVSIDKSMIGPPLKELIRLITPRLNDGEVRFIIENFRSCYDASRLERTVFKEGAEDALCFFSFRRKKLFVVTNKPKYPTMIILKNLKIDCFCDIITPDVQPDTLLSKTAMIAYVKNKWDLKRDSTIMIGDTASDIYAARDNGVISAAVLNGYGERASLRASNPDFMIERLNSLKNIIR